MKLVSVAKSGEERLGLLARELVVDLVAAGGDRALFADALAFIKGGDTAMKAARAILTSRAEGRLHPAARRYAGGADPAVDHPVQRQQLQGSQRRKG